MSEKTIEELNNEFILETHMAVQREAQAALTSLGINFNAPESVDDQIVGLNINMSSAVEKNENPSLPDNSVLRIEKNNVVEYEIWVKYESLNNGVAARVETLITSSLVSQ